MNSRIKPTCIHVRIGIALLGLIVLSSGCIGLPGRTSTSEDEFGNRVEDESEDGRQTLSIQAPEEGREFNVLPAAYETVAVRPQTLSESGNSQGVSVELLIKGSLPDACTELHSATQERTGNIIRVDLKMRRPKGMVCATVLRPYRFYLTLDGTYETGPYTMILNDRAKPFEIR